MYDLVIKNARELNGKIFDIGIEKGKICEIAPLITQKARQEISLTPQQYLSAGWIDDHVHCFE